MAAGARARARTFICFARTNTCVQWRFKRNFLFRCASKETVKFGYYAAILYLCSREADFLFQ